MRPFEPFDTQQGTWTGSFRFLAVLQSVSCLFQLGQDGDGNAVLRNAQFRKAGDGTRQK